MTVPSSERTADVRQGTHWEGCWRAHLECAVARNQQLQEALAVSANRFDLIRRMIKNSKTAPNIWESLADTAKWGEEAARAALASVRARTPA